MSRRAVLILWLACTCVGCGATRAEMSVSRELYLHMLPVDTDGGPVPLRTRDDRLRHASNQQHVDDIVAEIERLGARHIMLIIHGGLVSREVAAEEARKCLPNIAAECDAYPIFVNWETGLVTSYKDHLFFVRQGERSSAALFTWPLYLIADLGRALARLPLTLLDQGTQNLEEIVSDDTPSPAPDGWAETMWLDRENEQTGAWQRTRSWMLAIVPGVARLVTTPFLDGLGRSAFLNMRRRARVLFLLDQDFEAQVPVDHGALSLLMGGLRSIYYRDLERTSPDYDELLEQVYEHEEIALGLSGPRSSQEVDQHIEQMMQKSLQLREMETSPLRITVIAHSMGAIVANELLYRHQDLDFDDIVYMAAACTIREFSTTALSYIKDSPTTRFFNLTLHPAEENDDRYGNELLPHGSLLDWIDAYITDQESLLDRTLGKWENVAHAFHAMSYIPRAARRRMLVRGFARAADSEHPDYPQDHGDFNDRKFHFWNEEYWDFRLDPRTRERCRLPQVDLRLE